MNTPDEHDEVISRHRLAEPSPGLQERVLRAGKNAWERPDEIPWRIPVLRFAACLALSVVLIAVANSTAPRFVTEEQRPPARTVADDLPELGGVYGRLYSASIASRDAIPRFVEQQRMLRELLSGQSGEKTHEG